MSNRYSQPIAIPHPRQRRTSFYGPPPVMVSPQQYSPQQYSPPQQMDPRYAHHSMSISPPRQRRNSIASSSSSYSPPQTVDLHMRQHLEDRAVAREMIRERAIEDPTFAHNYRVDRHYAARKLDDYTKEAAHNRVAKYSKTQVRVRMSPTDVKFITPRPGHRAL